MKKLLLLLLCVPLLLFSQKKKGIALVIGNENYNEVSLKNPINDANLIAETLEDLGHDVVIHHNITTKSKMMEILKDFKSTGKGYDMVFIYYAGDGAQIYNANFLFPTKESFQSEKDVVVNSISAQYILNYLKEMTDNLMIMMIDVNRNNPFKESSKWDSFWGKSNNGKKFLKSLDTLQPPNSLISFSTQSGGMSSHYYIRYEGGYLALEGSSEEYEKSRLDLYEKRLLEKNIIRDANIFYVKEDGVRLFRDSLSVTAPRAKRGNVRHTLLEGQEVVLLSSKKQIRMIALFVPGTGTGGVSETVYIRAEDIKNSRSSQGWISLESLIPYPLTFLTSDYSKILSKNIILWHNNSNLSISEAFKNVRSEMRTITHNQQTPTLSNNLSSEDIFFIEDSDDKFSDRGLILYDKQKDNISIDSSQYHALIIAVEEYDDPNILDLEYPINDAQRFKDVLINHYNFNKENVRLMKNPKKQEVEDALDDLDERINDNDNLLIFYAGHGEHLESQNTGFWWLADAQQRKNKEGCRPGTILSNRRIKEVFNSLDAQHVLLITDACYAGKGLFDDGKQRGSSPNRINSLYSRKSRKAMVSGVDTKVPDKSIFIDYLLKALENNQDKYLTAAQLFSNFEMNVMDENPEQIPVYGRVSGSGDNYGQFIFIRKSN